MKRFIIQYVIAIFGIAHGIQMFGMQQLSHRPTQQSCNLINFSTDITQHVLSYCYQAPINNTDDALRAIITLLTLECVCKKFHRIFNPQRIGILFGDRKKQEKDMLLEAVTFSKIKKNQSAHSKTASSFYSAKRPIILGLLHAGAEYAKGKDAFIYSALANNDLEAMNYLFDKQHIDNLYQTTCSGTPLFFFARTIEMAQLYKTKAIEFDTASNTNQAFPNILWTACAMDDIPSDLVKFYLEQNVPIINCIDGCTLLHKLADSIFSTTNIENTIAKANLLLAQQPELINAINDRKKTPLDLAQDLKKTRFADFFVDKTPITKFIAFLEGDDEQNDTNDCVIS